MFRQLIQKNETTRGPGVSEVTGVTLVDAKNQPVAYVCGAAFSRPDAARNIGLMAAGEELLEAAEAALQLIIDHWPHEHGNPQVGNAWGLLHSAIEQATGKPPAAKAIDMETWKLRWLSCPRVARNAEEFGALVDRLTSARRTAARSDIDRGLQASYLQEVEKIEGFIAASAFDVAADGKITPRAASGRVGGSAVNGSFGGSL